MTELAFNNTVKDAQDELAHTSYSDIQKETAYKWAARAGASYRNVLTAEGKSAKLTTYILAQEYEHEALEHAALVPIRSDQILSSIESLLMPYQLEAWSEIEMALGL